MRVRVRPARTPPRTAPCRSARGLAITVGRIRPSSVVLAAGEHLALRLARSRRGSGRARPRVDHRADIGLLVGRDRRLSASTRGTNSRDERRPRRRRATKMRCTEMQLWPANENAFAASFAAVPRGASAQHDRGRRVAELELHALAVRAFRDAPADVARAGERDQLHALVLDEHVADLAPQSRRRRSASPAAGRPPPRAREEQRRERRRGRRLRARRGSPRRARARSCARRG